MADIKLFKIEAQSAHELQARSVAIEKSLQNLLEQHLAAFLGVRFLATEYVTGKTHGGRIDTLGIDEDGCPVIIEYKKALDQNVINQGLYYLDWLVDHKAEFQLLVMQSLGKEVSEKIDWSTPRLLCIASDFTKFDEYAVQQISRRIDLLRYRRYDGDLLLLELVNTGGTTSLKPAKTSPSAVHEIAPDSVAEVLKPHTYFEVCLASCSPEMIDLWHAVDEHLKSLGEDVQMKQTQYYAGYRRLRNFASVEVHPRTGFHVIFVKVNPDSVTFQEGFTRDVRNIGHYGPGDLESVLGTAET